MHIDFHVHGALSKQTGFDLSLFQEKIAFAAKRGLHALLLSEHFNISGFETIYSELLKNFPFNGDYFLIEGVRVFPGMEVNIAEGPHLLAGGSLDDIVEFHASLADYQTKDNFCPAEIYFAKQEKMELLNIHAHPSRVNRQSHLLEAKYYHHFDAFEMNAKDLYMYGHTIYDTISESVAHLSLPVVAGSDTHHPLQFGTVYNVFQNEVSTIAEIKTAIGAKLFNIYIDEKAEEKVGIAIDAKKKLKAELLNLPKYQMGQGQT